MRFLVKVTMPVEVGNALGKKGALAKTLQSIIGELKPEAVYFGPNNGKRTAFIFLEIKEPSQIPAVAEPFFQALNAQVDFIPVMKPEDLQKAAPSIEKASKDYA
jgi:hypothetical protein